MCPTHNVFHTCCIPHVLRSMRAAFHTCCVPHMHTRAQDKERAVSSLRDTLATTKRTYEGRVSQLEGSLAMKDADISALREELSVARAEAEGLAYTARRESAAVGHELDSLRMREAELVRRSTQVWCVSGSRDMWQ
eukprot:350192-Chlamydomonas_euryale.AAC.1